MSLAKLAEERRARLSAERLLEQKEAELQAAVRKLSRHVKASTPGSRVVPVTPDAHTARTAPDIPAADQDTEAPERRLWRSITALPHGLAVFDYEGRMIAANPAWLSVWDEMEEVQPGVSYIRLLQLATEEGVIDTGGEAPLQWRQRMLDRWHNPQREAVVLRLWSGQYIKLIEQRGQNGDLVSLALNITDTIRCQAALVEAWTRAEGPNRAKSATLRAMRRDVSTAANQVGEMAKLLNDTRLTRKQRLHVETARSAGERLLLAAGDAAHLEIV